MLIQPVPGFERAYIVKILALAIPNTVRLVSLLLHTTRAFELIGGSLLLITAYTNVQQRQQSGEQSEKGGGYFDQNDQKILLGKGRCINLVIEWIFCSMSTYLGIHFLFSHNYRNSIQDTDNRYYR